MLFYIHNDTDIYTQIKYQTNNTVLYIGTLLYLHRLYTHSMPIHTFYGEKKSLSFFHRSV